MRRQFVPVVLVVALAGCGGHSKSAPNAEGVAGVEQSFTPAKIVKTTNGRTPGIVLLPDVGAAARAKGEAAALAARGFATIVVDGPATVPTKPVEFQRAVKQARLAIDQLRSKSGIDAARIGVIGEGVGAHVAAVAIGGASRPVAAAVLADVGGVVVPSGEFAPAKWLAHARGTEVLFQRDLGERAMTQAEVKRLLLASPLGTVMHNFKKLGAGAQKDRANWLAAQLIVG
jgi:hypothetical protein